MEKPAVSRLVLGAVILVATYFLAQGAVRLASLWMLIFGAVIVAVVIRSLADPLVARFNVKDGVAVAISILILVFLLSGAAFLFGRQVAEQFDQLATRLPGAWAMLQARLDASPAASQIVEQAKAFGSEAGKMLAIAPRFAMGALSGLATLFLVIVAGVFLASQPQQAREGVLCLFPKDRRPRLREVMNTCGRALKGWLKAQLVSMVLVGGLISAGLALIGAPAPLALGLFTGLAQFVPIVGPMLAAVPALLVSATGGGKMLLMTLALYVGVSQLESNLITPLVQKNLAALPVVLGIFAVVGLGTLFGPLGVLFATPLALVIYVAVTMLYRHDVLHDEEATAPGQQP